MLNGLMKKFAGKKSSKDTAKKRLQFALVYDKLEINEMTLESLQKDIVEVISKYFEIDTKSLQLEVQREQELSALVFNTPILCVKKNRAYNSQKT
ncbi:MAG: cell division topological specificity factor MinE [Desulfamplus sp.]|nr:cell division topological specificity factor MinE [Desulfamplus sp.]MBF0209622.1 cell division topological specificity factor MinE [Desulfamplus sp.]MBF0241619.1 cell division topological specificity factor MinE [Desulfamplus sp.]MBF0388653.1 cell division topological specificity factor MinE [Desulfamplus sp.]